MASKSNIAYRKAEALKAIEQSLGGDIYSNVPNVRNADMRIALQLEAIAESLQQSNAPQKAEAVKPQEYPENFPYRELLESQASYEEVQAMSEKDLIKLEDIGKARAKEIKAY